MTTLYTSTRITLWGSAYQCGTYSPIDEAETLSEHLADCWQYDDAREVYDLEDCASVPHGLDIRGLIQYEPTRVLCVVRHDNGVLWYGLKEVCED